MGIKSQHIIVFILCFCQSALFSQMGGVEKIDGKSFKIYNVQKGNTLFSLSNELGVPVDSIIHYNPTVASGLKIGQRLLIPIPNNESTPAREEPTRFKQYKHVVKKQETLFGISRKYNCSIDDITAANPGIENGLQIGQYLMIPCFQEEEEEELLDDDDVTQTDKEGEDPAPPIFVIQDSILRYTVQPGETLYSISRRYMVPIKELKKRNHLTSDDIAVGSVLLIPIKSEHDFTIESQPISIDSPLVKIRRKESYNVVLLLPVKINNNPRVFSGLLEPQTQLDNVTGFAIDFLMGAKIALDSLEKLGLNAQVHVLDTEGAKEKMIQLLQMQVLQEADLIIGPFFSHNIEIVAQWAQEHKKNVIIPVTASAKTIEGNPYVSLSVPSDLTLIGGLAKYITKNHSEDKLFIVKGITKEDQDRNLYFQRVLEMYGRQMGKSINLREVSGGASGREFANLFDLDAQNIFISFSDNAQGVMRFINNINTAKNQSPKHGRAKVTVFGLRNWHNIDPLNSYYKNRFELHVAMPSFVNYQDEAVLEFVRDYRLKYKADASQFSLQGFDVVFFAMSKKLLGIPVESGLINHFNFDDLGPNYGEENTSAFIVSQKDYELHLVGVETYSLSRKIFPAIQDTIKSENTLPKDGTDNEE